MQASSIPTKFPLVWASGAASGYIRQIPVNSQIGIQNGAASLTDGFPPLTFLQEAAGGVPPFGQDSNGILNQITAWIQWQNAGAVVSYDSAFSTAIGGYPKGAILTSASSVSSWWVSAVDNNTTNPDAGGANWLLIAPALVYAGNPNTHLAGTAGNATTGQPPSQCWDTEDEIWWTCSVSGNAANALWVKPLGSGTDSYCGTSTGTANNHVLQPPATLQSLTAGTVISYQVGIGQTNTAALTLQIVGFGSYPTRKNTTSGPAALGGGEAVASNTVDWRFDGTYFHLDNPAFGTAAVAAQSSATGVVVAVQGAGSIATGNFLSAADSNGTAADSGFSPGSINSIGYTTLYMQGLLF